MRTLNIQIIGSGSKGNCIKFDDSILLDAGLSFSKIKDHVDGVKIVLLTHFHTDHYSPTTIRKLHIADEKIKFCCGDFLKKHLTDIGIQEKNIAILEPGKVYRKDGIIFSPVNLFHDVQNVGYRLIKGDYKHFHATDTFSLDGITAKNYDSATIEANHCLDAALKIIEESTEFTHMKRTIKTHLSVEKSIDFIKKNNIKKYIPVHIGSSTRTEVLDSLLTSNLEVQYDYTS